jgi:hypothetical protein
MRRGRDVTVIRDEEGLVTAVSLGADFCSEHEWGIKRTKQDFGIPTEVTRENAGLDYRRIRRVPTGVKGKSHHNFLYTEDFELQAYDRSKKKQAPLMGRALLHYCNSYSDELPGELRPWDSNFEFAAAWSDGDFGLLANSKDPRNVEAIDRLMLAFQDLDVAIWLGGGHVFENAGLCIGIVSRLGEQVLNTWWNVDMDGINLREAAEETGIYRRLKEAGRGYYACSPKWSHEIKTTKNGEVETKHPVIFFLNPADQQNNNFGWFTVEDLDAWCHGKGPIPMGK